MNRAAFVVLFALPASPANRNHRARGCGSLNRSVSSPQDGLRKVFASAKARRRPSRTYGESSSVTAPSSLTSKART